MSKKQQNKQLLILAGPSCAGKSTLIEKINDGQLPRSVYKQLQIEDLSAFPIFDCDDIKQEISRQFEGSIVLHYDLFNNYLDQNYHQNILKVIEQFDCVSIVTLFVPGKILLSRIQHRVIRTFIKICLKPSYFRSGFTYFAYQWDKYQRYLRTDIADEIYQEWLTFADANWVSNHWVLDSSCDRIEIKPAKILAVNYSRSS